MSRLTLQGEATTLVYRASHHQVQKVNWRQVESLTNRWRLFCCGSLNLCPLQCQLHGWAFEDMTWYDIGIMTLNQRRGFGTVFFEICTLEGNGRKGFRGQSCAFGHAPIGSVRESPGKHSPRCDLPSTLDDETARRIAALQGCTTSQQDFGYGEAIWIARVRWEESQSKPFPVQATHLKTLRLYINKFTIAFFRND